MRPSRPPLGNVDVFARLLTIICTMNINGVTSMVLGQEALASIVMLVCAAALVFYVGRNAWSAPFLFLMASISSYLILGLIWPAPMVAADDPMRYFRAYGGTLLILWGASGYVASLGYGPRLTSYLLFLRGSLMISSASVWFSPILYSYYTDLPFSYEQRMGGFFGNPNEAAMVSVLALVLTLGIPFRNRIVQFLALVVALVSVFLTFSKTGMVCVIIVLAWSLMRNAKGVGVILVPLSALGAILLVQDPDSILHGIVESPVLQLDTGQKNRILAIGDILRGQIDEETSTGRTYLWQLATQRALDTFPLGSGLGSGHQIVGGVMELGMWLGVHNSFLMMWVESGVLPPLLLVIAMGSALTGSLRHQLWPIMLPIVVILIVDMSVTHTTLATRYHNLMLAVTFGLLARRHERRLGQGHDLDAQQRRCDASRAPFAVYR